MSSSKGLVLDANILIRAVLGKRVRSLLEKYEDSVEFCAPDLCFEQAREYLPAILQGRGVDARIQEEAQTACADTIGSPVLGWSVLGLVGWRDGFFRK
jgi:hypothetical protein